MDEMPPLGDTETAKKAARLVSQINSEKWKKENLENRVRILEQTVTSLHRLLWIVGLFRSIRRRFGPRKKCGPKKRLLRAFLQKENHADGTPKNQ